MNNKLIYQFSSSSSEGDKSMTDLLGGKGANLAEMSLLGINVPPGFTVTTEVCNYFMKHGHVPENFDEELKQSLKNLEKTTYKIFDSDKKYVFHCAAGWRSALAVSTLKDMGFEATHISDGFAGWINEKGPIEFKNKK